jgi:hypothetical protein
MVPLNFCDRNARGFPLGLIIQHGRGGMIGAVAGDVLVYA